MAAHKQTMQRRLGRKEGREQGREEARKGGSKEGRKQGRKEMFYITTHSTHFIYGYMASDIL